VGRPRRGRGLAGRLPRRPGLTTLTYAEVGATLLDAPLPTGYGHLDVRRRVGGADRFDALSAYVLAWGLHRGAGLRVPPVAVTEGLEATLRLGPVRISVRVVGVVDEPERCGFAYGTLPGHPESGEEAVLAERDADGTWVRVRAFSRPARLYSRLGGPATRLAQRIVTERYLRAGQTGGAGVT
jgi:uncharacterized protein (UPF0548 family)